MNVIMFLGLILPALIVGLFVYVIYLTKGAERERQ